jgi:hypothetical protein
MRSERSRRAALVTLLLIPALAFAQERREPSDTETGPGGLACRPRLTRSVEGFRASGGAGA